MPLWNRDDATRLYNVEHDLRFVQDQAGHASPTTTAIYAKTNAKARRRWRRWSRNAWKAEAPLTLQQTTDLMLVRWPYRFGKFVVRPADGRLPDIAAPHGGW